MDWYDLYNFADPNIFCIASTTASTTDCFDFVTDPTAGMIFGFNQLIFWLLVGFSLVLFAQFVLILINIFKK